MRDYSLKSKQAPKSVELTDADMTVFNDYMQPITFTVDNNEAMDDKFPGSSVIPAGSSVSGYVDAETLTWDQSSFDVHFYPPNTNKMTIDIGQGSYKTQASPEIIPDHTAAAVLAPGQPLSPGVDYRFWFFNGPATLPPLINSVIQANLGALISFVNANPIKLTLINGVTVELASINASPQTLQCVYAAAVQQANSSSWIVNTVLNLGGATFSGGADVEGTSANFNLTVTDVTVWLQLEIDPTLTKPPQALQLQCSMGDYDLSGTILDVLAAVFPLWGLIIEAGLSAYHVAGAINNNWNSNILGAINGALKNMPLSHTPYGYLAKMFTEPHGDKHRRSTLPPLGKMLSTRRSLSDQSTWMSTPQVQNLTLGQLKIPGTHDSATYDLSSTLSSISYPNIQTLWYLSPSNAPNGAWPFPKKLSATQPLYLGPEMYNWVMGTAINSISRTQDVSISAQLQAGIRHLDFRVYYDDQDGNFYTQHALRGPNFEDLLSEIQGFLNDNASSGELIFAMISHTNFDTYPDQMPNLTSLINSYIPPENLYYQPDPSESTPFDFQSLVSTTVGSITNGAPKIMFINGDSPEITYADTITNTLGYSSTPWAGDVYTLPDLLQQQGPPTSAPHDPLWAVNWSLDATPASIVLNLLENFTTDNIIWALQSIATAANMGFPSLVAQYGTNFNLVTMDWFECGSIDLPSMIINMNASD